jgi:hypothetical protein
MMLWVSMLSYILAAVILATSPRPKDDMFLYITSFAAGLLLLLTTVFCLIVFCVMNEVLLP